MTHLIALIACSPLIIVSSTPALKLSPDPQEWTSNTTFTAVSTFATFMVTAPAPTLASPTPELVEEVWKVKLGDICQITRFPLPSTQPNRYLECVKPITNETDWPWADKGVWIVKQCPAGLEFHLLSTSCRSRRYIRRQQSLCATNPTAQFCPQPQQLQYSVQPQQQMMCQCPTGISVCACPQPDVLQPQVQYQTGCPPVACAQQPCPTQQVYCPQPPQPCPLASTNVANAREGDLCSWMLAPLAADPTSNKCFLQCVPAPGNAYCGRWVRMPCAPGTIFDVNLQVCVHDPYNIPGPVPGWSAANSPQMTNCNIGTSIGACNTNFQCPGQSVCQVAQPQSVACQQAPQSCSICCYTGGMNGYGK